MSNKKKVGITWNPAPRHTTPIDWIIKDERRREWLRCPVRAVSRLFELLMAQDRKLSLSGCLEWAEGALQRHVRNSIGAEAIGASSLFSFFFPSLLGFRKGW